MIKKILIGLFALLAIISSVLAGTWAPTEQQVNLPNNNALLMSNVPIVGSPLDQFSSTLYSLDSLLMTSSGWGQQLLYSLAGLSFNCMGGNGGTMNPFMFLSLGSYYQTSNVDLLDVISWVLRVYVPTTTSVTLPIFQNVITPGQVAFLFASQGSGGNVGTDCSDLRALLGFSLPADTNMIGISWGLSGTDQKFANSYSFLPNDNGTVYYNNSQYSQLSVKATYYGAFTNDDTSGNILTFSSSESTLTYVNLTSKIVSSGANSYVIAYNQIPAAELANINANSAQPTGYYAALVIDGVTPAKMPRPQPTVTQTVLGVFHTDVAPSNMAGSIHVYKSILIIAIMGLLAVFQA